jgi:hypothetical protein
MFSEGTSARILSMSPLVFALLVVATVESRFAPPEGFERVQLSEGSFGAFLRALPLAPAGTPVVSYRGQVIRPPDDEHVAAVATLDVGARDLQQCADSILRLHAEWRWARGDRELSYRSAEGAALPLSRYAAGERVVESGRKLQWVARERAEPLSHALLRRYLDVVFTWANTGSLARDGRVVALSGLAPGDFFVLPGSPGHAVLVLDLARATDGRRVVLLGQGFMPAQSFHVLRPSREGAWFAIDPKASGIKTPFWPTFPWSSLRRLSP